MDIDISKYNDRRDIMGQMLGEMVEAGRMRTDFALRHFVIGAHDTPGRQRAQALNELQVLYFSLADVYDEIELAELERAEILRRWRINTRARMEVKKLERTILQGSIHIFQRMKEVDTLLKVLQALPKYTAEELEAEEPLYWSHRLARQAFMAQRDPGGNLDAMLQILTTPGHTKPSVPIGPTDFLMGAGIKPEVIAAGLVNAGIITKEDAEKMLVDAQSKQITPPKRRRR